MIKNFLIVTLFLVSLSLLADDLVPNSVRYVKPVGAGFIELVGPGKMLVNGEVVTYEGTKYISINNIDSMTGASGISKGCTLHYSSENYTEKISVAMQSCSEIISIINIVTK
jgi:hypothetical protein